jgi:hypothetical protein
MKLEAQVNKEVNLKKKQLINRAKKHGFCENFGEKDIDKISEKFNYNDIVYGDPDERRAAQIIENFSDWVRDLSLEDIS